MATYNNTYKALEGQIMVETSKAILFRAIDKETGSLIKQEWFPKSQLASYGGTYDEIEGTYNFILASEWILGTKGLLSKAVDKSKLPSATVTPIFPQSAKEIKSRLPYKDDEDPVDGPINWDDYMEQERNKQEED